MYCLGDLCSRRKCCWGALDVSLRPPIFCSSSLPSTYGLVLCFPWECCLSCICYTTNAYTSPSFSRVSSASAGSVTALGQSSSAAGQRGLACLLWSRAWFHGSRGRACSVSSQVPQLEASGQGENGEKQGGKGDSATRKKNTISLRWFTYLALKDHGPGYLPAGVSLLSTIALAWDVVEGS